MTVLILADLDDLHWNGGTGHADVVLSCGDLFESLILEAAEAYHCTTALAVKGNHDRPAAFPPGVTDLHLNRVEIRGVSFGGFQGSWRYKPRGHYLYEQAEVTAALNRFPAVQVLVAHNSPRGVHDKDDETHYGFEAFLTYIKEQQPGLFIHGHQHIRKETMLGRTLVLGTFGHQLLTL